MFLYPSTIKRLAMKKLNVFSALMSILFGLLLLPSVYAAEITLNSRCSLADAILAANSDRAQGGCPAGNGAATRLIGVVARFTTSTMER